jgi:hypothetical protein
MLRMTSRSNADAGPPASRSHACRMPVGRSRGFRASAACSSNQEAGRHRRSGEGAAGTVRACWSGAGVGHAAQVPGRRPGRGISPGHARGQRADLGRRLHLQGREPGLASRDGFRYAERRSGRGDLRMPGGRATGGSRPGGVLSARPGAYGTIWPTRRTDGADRGEVSPIRSESRVLELLPGVGSRVAGRLDRRPADGRPGNNRRRLAY